MKPTLLYYLFEGKRFSGKRYGMYKWTKERYQILYDVDEFLYDGDAMVSTGVDSRDGNTGM